MFTALERRRRRIPDLETGVLVSRDLVTGTAQPTCIARLSDHVWIYLAHLDLSDVPDLSDGCEDEGPLEWMHFVHVSSLAPSVLRVGLREGEFAVRRDTDTDSTPWSPFWGGDDDTILQQIELGSLRDLQESLPASSARTRRGLSVSAAPRLRARR